MSTNTVIPSIFSLSGLNYIYSDYWEEAWDIRSRSYGFVDGGPWKMISAMGLYVYFCTTLGPRLMKNREAFELRTAMLLYNITTVVLNTFFFVASLYYLKFGLELFDFRFPHQIPEQLNNTDSMKTLLVYFYILTKVFDLSDTIFFVLRKKQNQITGKFFLVFFVFSLICFLFHFLLCFPLSSYIFRCFILFFSSSNKYFPMIREEKTHFLLLFFVFFSL